MSDDRSYRLIWLEKVEKGFFQDWQRETIQRFKFNDCTSTPKQKGLTFYPY
jgi:hypothetical protein